MIDASGMRVLRHRALFLAVVAGIVFVRLLPFRVGTEGFPAPDLVVLLIYAWVLRRPDHLPLALVAAVALFGDLIFLRPPGLPAALTVMGAEFLRARCQVASDMPFAVEWALVSGVLVITALAQAVLLGLVLVPQPDFAATAMQVAISAAVYPLVVVAISYGLGVRPPSPIERPSERSRA